MARLPATAPAPNLSALVVEATSRPATTKSQKMVNQATTTAKALQASPDNAWSRFNDWIVTNWGTLLLNFGSLCTLAAFTRTDVLELRSLSATGSTCNAVYHAFQQSSNWWSVIWPGIFASVNGYFITKILEERNATVHLSEQQEKIYVEYFMPHGITPKQFEKVEAKADVLRIPKDNFIIRKNVTTLKHVYLVVDGTTTASILGRHLSSHSVSSNHKKDIAKPGGDTGRWIGEMVFLDRMWEKEQERARRASLPKTATASIQVDPERQQEEQVTPSTKSEQQPAFAEAPTTKASRILNAGGEVEDSPTAIYSIVATKDCVVWRWSFDDMEKLMSTSTDMRGALTRAMTSAVVGKVVNMTFSRAKLPQWTAWLRDWNRDDGAQVQLKRIQTMPEESRIVSKETSEAS
ncbi:Popeye conserved region protein [Nitzschia inconspicua]|uniref:Popeye conserved region protein n=1 Tax=Nitzschia inconspicua TaxID=303405 RepID=A0A9K3LN57_9STRA|nr:Popeye conserved region protein [Nitzschia inconspicua]